MDPEQARDRALSALSRGDMSTAETYALSALRRDPKDPYALLIAGIVYQTGGKYDLARQYYNVIVTNRPPELITLPDSRGGVQERPIINIARDNLDNIDRLTGRNVARTMAESGKAPGAAVTPAPLANAEASVVGRFRILKRLLDEDLLTPDEYNARRSANLGVLLPLSQPPPAAGLERPIPGDNQIVDRLKALKAAIEAREMSPREAAAERMIILDALLPAQPKVRTLPPLPPKDVIEAADAVGRLERLHTQMLVSDDEVVMEKAAIDRALNNQLAEKPVEGTATGLRYGALPEAKPAAAKNAKGEMAADKGNWGVGLGTAKSEDEAKTLSDQIKAKFPEELKAVTLSVRKITIKGQDRWQVVGAAENKNGARKLCKVLKLHRQACDAVSL